jgi:hypothetical protein
MDSSICCLLITWKFVLEAKDILLDENSATDEFLMGTWCASTNHSEGAFTRLTRSALLSLRIFQRPLYILFKYLTSRQLWRQYELFLPTSANITMHLRHGLAGLLGGLLLSSSTFYHQQIAKVWDKSPSLGWLPRIGVIKIKFPCSFFLPKFNGKDRDCDLGTVGLLATGGCSLFCGLCSPNEPSLNKARRLGAWNSDCPQVMTNLIRSN